MKLLKSIVELIGINIIILSALISYSSFSMFGIDYRICAWVTMAIGFIFIVFKNYMGGSDVREKEELQA